MSASVSDVTIDDIQLAQERINHIARVTPMLLKDTLSPIVGYPVYLKCEHLQRTGSFKLRGAANILTQLTNEEKARGVVAASAGNHAQGVAVAAAEMQVKATIFMPEDASLAKVEATTGYGAEVHLEGAQLTNSLDAALEWCAEQGATFIHPFDDARIIAGQGTIGLEIIQQLPEVATVVVAIGGGGLSSGIATAIKSLRPECKIVGVQSASYPSFAAARDAGEPVEITSRPTMADGIAVKRVGRKNLQILNDLIDDYVTVEEDEIATAMLWGMERAKQVLEGAGAVPLAALLAGKIKATGPTVLVCGGGNVDPASLLQVIRHGLSAAGRFVHLSTLLPDRPGELSRLLALLAELRVNVLGVQHLREEASLHVGETQVDLVLQTRNSDHIKQTKDVLTAAGYIVIGE